MNNLTNTAAINAGIRGLLCAGLATVITASFSWSFVASTESLNWMGSGASATVREDNAGSFRLTLV
jgi:hypothetical protein